MGKIRKGERWKIILKKGGRKKRGKMRRRGKTMKKIMICLSYKSMFWLAQIDEHEPCNFRQFGNEKSSPLLRVSCKMTFLQISFQTRGLCVPKPFHFQPMNLHHLITVLYPKGVSDEDLGQYYVRAMPNSVRWHQNVFLWIIACVLELSA